MSDAVNSELMLFQPPLVQKGVEYTQWIECRPTNQITEDGSIDIQVKASGGQYLDLNRSRLHVKAKIIKEDGTKWKDTDIVTPVNLWMQSLWSQVDVYLQQKLVSTSGTNYPYKAMFDVMLNYGLDAKATQLQSQLYYKDSAGAMDHTKPNETPLNQGLILRNIIAKNGALVDMEGPLYADAFQMNRYLLNEVDVRVKLFQSKTNFRLMTSVTDTKFKVKITDVILKAAMMGISPEILKSHSRILEKKPAIYPIMRTDIKSFAIAKGQYNLTLNDIFQGKIPSRLVLGLVSADAYSGDLTKNPFNFHHYNYDFMCLYANGQSVPAKALQPQFSSKNYMEAYQTLSTGMGIDLADAGIACSRNDYPKGYALVVFDLSSEVSDADLQPLQKQGNLQLEVRFAEALPEAINIILYASFPGEISIDQARAVQLN